ncbi:MAG: HAD family hydrolase [Planctomycetaceae bacterium]|jgi:phosphoglycolate phosphatase-like HAD superfamily hydrolase|nr:HAD family hydrolase [Planctomycetaceae bacterium]
MFDFDGTVGLIRAGWHEILVSFHAEVLRLTPKGKEIGDIILVKLIKEYIETNIGKPPIYQSYSLVEAVRCLGGEPSPAEEYNDIYSERLSVLCEPRREALRRGVANPNDYLVSGVLRMLAMLRSRNIKIYMASGTEEHFVREDVKLLKIDNFFDGGVYGGQPDPKAFSKKIMVERILTENQIDGSELLGVGDGATETTAVCEAGGFNIGVASNEDGKLTVDSWKRRQLISAGTDWIIPNYTDTNQLEERLFVE